MFSNLRKIITIVYVCDFLQYIKFHKIIIKYKIEEEKTRIIA